MRDFTKGILLSGFIFMFAFFTAIKDTIPTKQERLQNGFKIERVCLKYVDKWVKKND